MEKQVIQFNNNDTLFLHKDLLEQILFFAMLQLSFKEAATMPVISEIPHCTCKPKIEKS